MPVTPFFVYTVRRSIGRPFILSVFNDFLICSYHDETFQQAKRSLAFYLTTEDLLVV